jgi:hypothetical protein
MARFGPAEDRESNRTPRISAGPKRAILINLHPRYKHAIPTRVERLISVLHFRFHSENLLSTG